MKQTVWVATWSTESSDRGVAGYWLEEPTDEQLCAYFYDYMPDEFHIDEENPDNSYRYVFWELEELELVTSKEEMPYVESI